jgi:hypothetical protein
VAVTLHYSCLPPSPGSLDVALDENGVLGGSTIGATCDGQNHSATLTVPGAFTPGTASGFARVENADIFTGASAEDTIAIK